MLREIIKIVVAQHIIYRCIYPGKLFLLHAGHVHQKLHVAAFYRVAQVADRIAVQPQRNKIVCRAGHAVGRAIRKALLQVRDDPDPAHRLGRSGGNDLIEYHSVPPFVA